MNNPTRTEKLPSDYDRTLIKGPLEEIEEMWEDHSSAGTQQKELEPLMVLREEDQQAMEFIHETGLMCEQTIGETEDIPIAKLLVFHTSMENLLPLRRRRSL